MSHTYAGKAKYIHKAKGKHWINAEFDYQSGHWIDTFSKNQFPRWSWEDSIAEKAFPIQSRGASNFIPVVIEMA